MLTFKLCDTDSYRFNDALTCSYTSYEDSLKICKEQNFTGFVVFKNRVYYRNNKFEDLITNYVYHKDSILYILVPEEYNKHFIQNNERLEFYTKGIMNQKHQLNPTSTHQNSRADATEKFYNISTLEKKIDSYDKETKKFTKQHHEMLYEYLKVLKVPAHRGFFIHPYDLRFGMNQPCFVKSRPIKNSKCSVLLPLEKLYLPHHMYPDIKEDIKFEHKKNSVVWRGANSGYRANEARRINLVEKFYDYSDFDIGFSNMVYTTDKHNKDYIKKKLSIQAQLQFKFILSVEGNDFATNFSWIMLSNSIPICPIHVIETWFMESKLVPYVHYIPVKNDFSDLNDVYKSVLDDHELCQKILFNKKMFCANFLDPQNEDELIKDTINVYFNQCNNISNEIKLIQKNRIDVVIGVEYVDFYENKYNTEFFTDLYIEHKRAFNGLREGKYIGKEQHIQRFNNLIDSIKEETTNTVAIPVYEYNNEYWVVNGFHRTSILSYYNLYKNVEIESRQKPIESFYYPTEIYFFKNRKYDMKYCHYTMNCFFKKYCKDFQCIILFPNKKQLPDTLFHDIKEHMIYHIEISLSNLTTQFHNNFIQLLYYDEGWCKKGGYKAKATPCFQGGEKLKVYFIEKQELNTLVQYKQKVRNFYNTGKHSIHIPDTQNECDSLLALLNHNTISFMDKAPSLYVTFPNFTRLLNKLKQFCRENNVDTNKISITSSSVLSVYGIRDCGDMDLFIDKKYVDTFKDTCFDNDNQYTIDKHYPKHFEDIIYNPDNHFYYQGMKFCNLAIILEYKKYRVQNQLYGRKSIEKDVKDIECIEQFL